MRLTGCLDFRCVLGGGGVRRVGAVVVVCGVWCVLSHVADSDLSSCSPALNLVVFTIF